MDLQAATTALKVLAEPTRVRLLALLEQEELTVAELAAVTLLAQPRVSTHLGKLRELELVRDRKAGVQSYYRFNGVQLENGLGGLWKQLRSTVDDALLEADRERLPAVLAARAKARRWADSVAGDMERHYSPGRTWEATARSVLQLADLGDVLDVASGDGVLAELLAPRSRSVTCVDASEPVVDAAQRRLKHLGNVAVRHGDMHTLPFDDAAFDIVVLMHALTYTDRPGDVLTELARVLRPGGRLLLTTLKAHEHRGAVAPYDHVNMGFSAEDLDGLCGEGGLQAEHVGIVSRETRPPHFEVITLLARR
ncbi:MAG: metalloregulator ArsR/SmtB family transcription factor [Pseudomonadota bacterium]